MNFYRLALSRGFLAVLIVLLPACGPTPIRPGPTRVNIEPVSGQAAATISPTALPAATSSPTPTSLPLFPLDDLRSAYIADGNLYLQTGSGLPRLLADGENNLAPILSDDGAKVVFYRGRYFDNNYIDSMDADGSHEKVLITQDWLDKIAPGTKAGSLVFVPGTHTLLANTYRCPPEDLSAGCATGLFLLDADTGAIKQLIAPALGHYLPFGGGPLWRGNFSVSPDGKLLSVGLSGHIDIFTLNGGTVYHDILTYAPTTPVELVPRMFWLPDSRGMLIALAAERNYGGGYEMQPSYALWRYDLGSKTAVQIASQPSPKWTYMECNDIVYLSPNGKWAVYSHDTSLNILNLEDGSVQTHALGYFDCSPVFWDADNIHFIYGLYHEALLGDVNNSFISLGHIYILGWVDSTHYIYYVLSSDTRGTKRVLVGEIRGNTIRTFESGISLAERVDPISFAFVILDNKTPKK